MPVRLDIAGLLFEAIACDQGMRQRRSSRHAWAVGRVDKLLRSALGLRKPARAQNAKPLHEQGLAGPARSRSDEFGAAEGRGIQTSSPAGS